MTNLNAITLSNTHELTLVNGTIVLNADNSFTTHFSVEDNSELTVVLLHQASQDITMNATFDLGKNCALTFALVSLVPFSYDGNICFNFNGDDSSINVQSGLLGNATKKLAMTINHLTNRCVSKMDHYGLITGHDAFTMEASGVVKQYAKDNDCRQALRCATFTDSKAITLKPMLYIDDYDCQAAQACTIGQISPRQMYYLQSKGLSRKAIMALIAKGYMQPVVDCVTDENVHNYLSELMASMEENYVR